MRIIVPIRLRSAFSNFSGPVANVATSVDANCNGGSDGQATINIISGTGPFTYQWSPSGGNAVTATGLPAGNYVVQVTDANQCLTSVPVVISEPAVLGIVANTTATLCDGSADEQLQRLLSEEFLLINMYGLPELQRRRRTI